MAAWWKVTFSQNPVRGARLSLLFPAQSAPNCLIAFVSPADKLVQINNSAWGRCRDTGPRHPDTCCEDTRTCIQMHTHTCKKMQTYIHFLLTDTHTHPLPYHLWAVCLKWQCLSVILRQIGREHGSIKGSHGATEGWNNGWWKWQHTQRCSLLNGLSRGGNFAPLAWLYMEEKTAQFKIGAYLTDFVCVFILFTVVALALKVVSQKEQRMSRQFAKSDWLVSCL